MKVYLAMHELHYEANYVLGAYSTAAKAAEACCVYIRRWGLHGTPTEVGDDPENWTHETSCNSFSVEAYEVE